MGYTVRIAFNIVLRHDGPIMGKRCRAFSMIAGIYVSRYLHYSWRSFATMAAMYRTVSFGGGDLDSDKALDPNDPDVSLKARRVRVTQAGVFIRQEFPLVS